eukprot:c22758_g1_i1 orf=352-2967(-)
MTTRSLRWSHQQVASYGALACLRAACGGFIELHREGPMKDPLQIMVNLDEHDVPLTRDTIYLHLQVASKQKDLKAAHRLHSVIISNGFESDAFLIDHLIRLFTLCGKLLESQQVFHKISKANVYSWNALIQAHARLGEEDRILKLLELMGQMGCIPDKCTFCCVLKACGCIIDLSHGMLIHDQIVSFGMESDLLVGSALLFMYGKCGSLDSMRRLFDSLPNRDIVSWCTVICALGDHGDGLAAFDFFRRMQCEGVEPNEVVFLSLLKACIALGVRWQGMMVHDAIIRCGYQSDKAISNTLVDMYAKCGSVDEAYQIFCTAACKDVVTWGAMMSGYAQHGYASCAFNLFKEVHQVGIEPSQAIALCALKACSSLGALKEGMLTNCCIVSDGFEADVGVGSALIDMYGRCGCLLEAQKVFKLMKEQDIAAWGTLIAGYAQCGLDYQAFELFAKLEDRSLSPDAGIFLSILKACTSTGSLERGRLVHGQVTKLGFFLEGLFGSSLVNMYAKLGSFKDAQTIFNDMENPDVASWGALIGGYAHYGHGSLALKLYSKMHTRSMKPDKAVYLCALKACGSIGALVEGRFIHNQVLDSGLELEMAVGGSLVDMYSKCGSLDEALKVLKELPKQSAVSWAPLIEGCVQHGKECLAFELFVDMQKKGIKPDRTIYLFAARACASNQNSANGRLIHDQVVRSGFDELNTELTNVLVDMYAKWGQLDEALRVFQRIQDPDVISWGTLIAGYALSGHDRRAKLCLENMQIQGFKPDSIMGTGIFSACCRSGLLEEGCSYFNAMEGDHRISPHVEHYNSMIDLFGRMGHLKQAEDMLQTMSSSPVVTGWTCLITSCRTYGNVGLGSRCFDISAQSVSCTAVPGY